MGSGPTAQFLQDGMPPQLNVVIAVGDTVKWVNEDTLGTAHTATSDVSVDGRKLFDTDRIAAPGSHVIEFNQALYDKAARAINGADTRSSTVHLGYYCRPHEASMGGKLVLLPSGVDKNAYKKKAH